MTLRIQKSGKQKLVGIILKSPQELLLGVPSTSTKKILWAQLLMTVAGPGFPE